MASIAFGRFKVVGPVVFVAIVAFLAWTTLPAPEKSSAPVQEEEPAPPPQVQQSTSAQVQVNWWSVPSFLIGLLGGILVGILGTLGIIAAWKSRDGG